MSICYALFIIIVKVILVSKPGNLLGIGLVLCDNLFVIMTLVAILQFRAVVRNWAKKVRSEMGTTGYSAGSIMHPECLPSKVY